MGVYIVNKRERGKVEGRSERWLRSVTETFEKPVFKEEVDAVFIQPCLAVEAVGGTSLDSLGVPSDRRHSSRVMPSVTRPSIMSCQCSGVMWGYCILGSVNENTRENVRGASPLAPGWMKILAERPSGSVKATLTGNRELPAATESTVDGNNCGRADGIVGVVAP